MSHLRRRFVRAIVRLYPSAWRMRYEDELLALIEDTGASPRVLVDMCLGLMTERFYAATGWTPGEQVRLGAAGLADMLALALVGASLCVLSLPVGTWLGGYGLTRVPFWPLFPLVAIFAPLRGWLGLTAFTLRPSWPWVGVSLIELCGWLAVLFVGSVWSFVPVMPAL